MPAAQPRGHTVHAERSSSRARLGGRLHPVFLCLQGSPAPLGGAQAFPPLARTRKLLSLRAILYLHCQFPTLLRHRKWAAEATAHRRRWYEERRRGRRRERTCVRGGFARVGTGLGDHEGGAAPDGNNVINTTIRSAMRSAQPAACGSRMKRVTPRHPAAWRRAGCPLRGRCAPAAPRAAAG